MMLFSALVLFLMLITACVAAPTSPRVNASDPELARRWVSIPEDHEVAPGHIRPWPLGRDGSRTITYCFKNVDSYQGLHHIFELGLAKWEPAMRLSALKFAPDPACQQEPCLCDEPDVDEGTLHIFLSEENPSAWGSQGYRGPDVDVGADEFRNFLRWPTNKSSFNGPLSPLLMAHEIGHVLGFGHEHERPDALDYVVFDCRYLEQYEEAKALVEQLQLTDEPAFTADMDIDDKMSLICNRRELATKYFRQALNWMIVRADPQKKLSRDFDYNSIMIYDSGVGRASDAEGYPLVTKTGELIHIGGDPDPDQAGISDLDIERVVELYTTGPAESPSTPQDLPSTPGGSETMPQGSHPTPGEPSKKPVEKRWWSIPEEHETQPEDIRPWPPGEDGSRTIAYCFENQASYDSLHEILALALVKWEPAVQASALAFAPDSACTSGPCLCSTHGVAEVTLRISLADPKKQQQPLSTMGYTDRIVKNPYPNMPRNFIMWPYTPHSFGPNAVLVMAHELGHVVGFMHEQERPDTRKWTKFDCGALDGFEEAKKLVASVEPANGPAFTGVDSRMDLVCARYSLAHQYFKQAAVYLPRDDPTGVFRVSDDFDYNSIMVFSSDVYMVPGSNRFPLLTTGGDQIFTGGHPDPRRAGLSCMDIERVMRLYPKRRGAPPQAPGGRPGKRVTKRWHTIPFESEARPEHARAWPAFACDGTTWITYCYENQAAHDALNGLFMLGLAKWAQGFRQSSIVFAADPACGINHLEPCLCTENGILEHTVHIMQGRDGETITWPLSTLGYREPSPADDNMPIHFIQWPTNAGIFNARGPLFMAQQIGRVMGFRYEHQRRAAATYLRFNCLALEHYPEAERIVASLDGSQRYLRQDMSLQDRMNVVCRTRHLAKKYFRQAADFIPAIYPRYHQSPPDGQRVQTLDFHSLMIFDPMVGRAPGQQYYPLVPIRNDAVVIMGGNANPALAGPSELEIERLSALYPPPPPNQAFNFQQGLAGPAGKRSVPANATQSTEQWLKVEGPGGFTTTIGPVRTEQPTEAPATNRSTKRWYSVPDSQNAALEVPKPWPPEEDGRRVIRWCHEDEASMDALGIILAWGRWTWEKRLHYPEEASLFFGNDLACAEPLSDCLCSTPGVSDETLRISLSQDEESQFDATLGYRDPIVASPDPSKPRHWLHWPSDPEFFGDAGGLMMGHLLGRVAGLGYEHQRPDARRWVKFDCSSLNGYEETRRHIMTVNDEPAFNGKSVDDRMALVCGRLDLADKHFKLVKRFLPREDTPDMFRGEAFDYKSIMIYDSFNGRADGAQGYPLLSMNNEFIYICGEPEPWLAKPSKMDVERIKALYPKRQVPMFAGRPINPRSDGANNTESNNTWVKVEIPGVTTTSVMPLPTDFPKSVNDSRALEIAKKYSAKYPFWVTEDESECK